MTYIFLLLIFLLSLQKIISIIGKYDKHYWTRKNLNVRHTTKEWTSVCLAMTWCRVTLQLVDRQLLIICIYQ